MRAQIAANAKGSAELKALVAQYGAGTVRAYMQHVQDNAEESVRRVITSLKDGVSAQQRGACYRSMVGGHLYLRPQSTHLTQTRHQDSRANRQFAPREHANRV